MGVDQKRRERIPKQKLHHRIGAWKTRMEESRTKINRNIHSHGKENGKENRKTSVTVEKDVHSQ